MLEYSCSNLPDTFAGSFLLVSGIRYSYDYRKNPRVQSVEVAGIPLNLEKTYRLATFFYLSSGGDGFSMIKNCKFLVDQIAGIDLLRLILRFFKGLDNSLEPKRK
jgi:2',3'-cyclic-nucleotide 2'-phosphodiesterase (5'-nucleotidase family)